MFASAGPQGAEGDDVLVASAACSVPSEIVGALAIAPTTGASNVSAPTPYSDVVAGQ